MMKFKREICDLREKEILVVLQGFHVRAGLSDTDRVRIQLL